MKALNMEHVLLVLLGVWCAVVLGHAIYRARQPVPLPTWTMLGVEDARANTFTIDGTRTDLFLYVSFFDDDGIRRDAPTMTITPPPRETIH